MSFKQNFWQLLIVINLFSSLPLCMAAEPPLIKTEKVCSSVNLTKESVFYDRTFFEIFSINKSKVFSITKQKLLPLDQQLNENYRKLLKEHSIPNYNNKWIMQNTITSVPAQAFYHRTEGDLIGVKGCKPHWCDTEKIYLLFSPTTKKITITIQYPEGSKSFGQLPSTLKSECLKG